MSVFDNSEFEKYQAEVQQKWGQTESYTEFSVKTKNYNNDKWNNLAEGMDNIMREFAVCMNNGNAADSLEVQNLVKMLQNYISENYYQCTNDILSGLGQMYVLDERFKNNIDVHSSGTAEFICKAIKVYCKK